MDSNINNVIILGFYVTMYIINAESFVFSSSIQGVGYFVCLLRSKYYPSVCDKQTWMDGVFHRNFHSGYCLFTLLNVVVILSMRQGLL